MAEFDPGYMVHVSGAVGKAGSFERPNGLQELEGVFQQIKERFVRGENPVIALHFHGGVVPLHTGIDLAHLLKNGKDGSAPTFPEPMVCPISFIWESGLDEVLRQAPVNRLVASPLLKEDRVYQSMRKRLEEAVRETQARAGWVMSVGVPPSVRENFREKLKADLNGVDLKDTHIDPETKEEIRREAEKVDVEKFVPITVILILIERGLRILDRCITRFNEQRDHGIHNTVVEELLRALYLGYLGGRVWKTMKDNTLAAFQPGNPGQVVLAQLRALQDAGHNPRVVLLGHSAGSIYICHLLQKAQALAPALRFDVILTCPACTYRLFAKTLDEAGHAINRLRIFTLKSDSELADTMMWDYPEFYHSSLLYFISGLLEPSEPPHNRIDYPGDVPLLGMQRFLQPLFTEADFAPLKAAQNLIEHNALWTPDDKGSKWRSNGTRHANFDTEKLTLQSIRELLLTGF